MWPFSDSKIASREFKRLLIRVPNPLGDMIMATSALDALKERYPNTAFIGHGTGLAEGIFDGGGWFDEFIVVGRKESVFDQAKRLRAANVDACLLLSGSLRTAFPPFFARIKHRIGYRWSGRTWTLTAHFERPRPGGKKAAYPTKHYFLDLVANLGADGDHMRPVRLGLTEEDKTDSAAWLASHGVGAGEGYFTMAVGAGFGPSKIWPLERFAEVADAMVERHGAKPILLCGPNELDLGETVVKAMKHKIANYGDPMLPTPVLKGVIAGCRMMVCNDIGPRHVAAAFNRPIVCMMGSTDPIYSQTDMDNQIVILAEGVDCMPCHLKVCPIDHPCMKGITTDMVLPEVERAWEANTQA